MKKRKTAAFLAALMICAWVPQAVPGDSGVLVAEAHSGRTDRYGGHRDNKNKSGLGSYHYHCGGHPAHLHENGVCPYASYVEEAAPAVSPEETVAEAPENLYMVFDPIYYADHNSDLYEAFGYDTDQLQEHFLTCGMKEGRPGCADSMWQYIRNRMQTWRRPTEMIWRPTIPIIWAAATARGASAIKGGKK